MRKRPQLPDVQSALPARFGFGPPKPVRRYEVGTVVLGKSGSEPVALPRRPRFEHTHVIGTTGGGKTNLLEHLIRQDIKNGDGVYVCDPHGSHSDSLFRSLLTWLFANGYHKKRTIHLIDANGSTHTTGFNPLELPDDQTSPSVIAGTTLEAFERVWGDENTQLKPTIRRVLKGTFAALCELRMTLAEADFLFDHHDALGVRDLVLSKVTDRYARKVFADLDQLARADRTGLRFRDEIVGPLNRLAEFTSSPAIRRIVGQRHNTIDLRAALDEGHIILVNLSGGDAVNDADCELLGKLLTRFVFFHVKRRTTTRPFWLYLDECQRFLSGDIPSLLAEARKFSTGVLLSHQWQSQLGAQEEQTLAAVHNATNVKIAFRVKHPKEAQEIAEAIIPLDLEMPVQALIKPTVIGHQRAYFENWSETDAESWGTATSESDSDSFTENEGTTATHSASASDGWNRVATTNTGQTQTYDGRGLLQPTPQQTSFTCGTAQGYGESGSTGSGTASAESSGSAVTTGHATTTTETYAHSHSESHGASEGLEPVYENLPSAVHSYQNALYYAAQKLRTLAAGEAFASYVDGAGLHATAIRVPRVRQFAVSKGTYAAICSLVLSKSPSALATPLSAAQLQAYETQLLSDAQQVPELDAEPASFRVPATRNK